MHKIIAATTLLVFLSAAPVFAHCGKCGVGDEKGSMKGKMTAEGKIEMLSGKLGLSAEQAGKLKMILDEKMAKKQAAYEQKKATMDAIHEEYQMKLKGILTDEQYQKYEAMKAEKAAMHEHKGSMMEHKGSMMEHKGSN